LEISQQKSFLYNRLLAEATGFGLQILKDLSAPDKPWGAYLRLSEDSLPAFFQAYWPDVKINFDFHGHKLDPKILLVAPGARLSLQYHHRRQEHWRVLAGPVKIVLGPDGTSLQEKIYNTGELIEIPQGYWHRVAGGNGWGIIAEIWEHTDAGNPSDEDDIIRVDDDYSRG
jgi:mannose-6-phosphate isomerase-like protein (cupin superfamily)